MATKKNNGLLSPTPDQAAQAYAPYAAAAASNPATTAPANPLGGPTSTAGKTVATGIPASSAPSGLAPAFASLGQAAGVVNPGSSSADDSARALINSDLAAWGLQSLGDTAWNEYLNGVPIDQIIMDIRSSDTYKQRFPGMAALVASGQAISEAQYIAKESADTEMLRAYGVPNGMISRDELGKLIGNQVSTTELQGRLNDYQDVVQKLPQQVRDYFQSKYGASPGDLLGFWLDPNTALPLIEQKTKAAEIGGAAAISGWGDLDLTTANHLAGFFTDFNQTLAGFGKATQLTGLTQALPDQQAGVNRNDLLNAELGGDALAQQRVQNAADAAKAQFAGGGDFLTGTKGATGLGVPSA